MSQSGVEGKKTIREVISTWCRCYWIGIIGVPIAAIIALVAVVSTNHEGASASSQAAVVKLSAADYTQRPGLPPGVTVQSLSRPGVGSPGVYARWTSSRTKLEVVLFGGSNCVAVPTSIRAITNTRIDVVFAVPTPKQGCLPDSSPTITTLAAPKGLRSAAHIHVSGKVQRAGKVVTHFSVTTAN